LVLGIFLVTRLQLGNGFVLEALLRERGSGTGIESQSAPAKRSFKDILSLRNCVS
jgi:hypothetical protein